MTTPTQCLLIVLGLLTLGALIGAVWVEVREHMRSRRAWREGRPDWIRILK